MCFKQKLGGYARIKPENSQTITSFSADIPLKVQFSMNKTEKVCRLTKCTVQNLEQKEKIKLLTFQMKQFRNTFSSIARAYDSIFIPQILSLLFSSAAQAK